METKVNKAGRPIWFAPSRDGGGVYTPVARRQSLLVAILWIMICGIGGMAGFALTWDSRWFVAMFVLGAFGLGIFAAAVVRHS